MSGSSLSSLVENRNNNYKNDENLPNSKLPGNSILPKKRENRKRNVSNVNSSDFDGKNNNKKSFMSSEQKESRFNHLIKELCPLVDRFGRALTDLSPLLRDLADANSPSEPIPVAQPAPSTIEASLLSLLRERLLLL